MQKVIVYFEAYNSKTVANEKNDIKFESEVD